LPGAHFQSSLPGLYFSGLSATRDFGPFFGCTVCPLAAGRVMVEHVRAGRGQWWMAAVFRCAVMALSIRRFS
jgi:hypothetical protein